MHQRRVGLLAGEVLQVLRGGPVAADGADGRFQDMLVVAEELLAQFRHADRAEG